METSPSLATEYLNRITESPTMPSLLARLLAVEKLIDILREEKSYLLGRLPCTLDSVKFLADNRLKIPAIIMYRKVYPHVKLEIAKLWVEQYCTGFPACPMCNKITEQRYITSYGQCVDCYNQMITDGLTQYKDTR